MPEGPGPKPTQRARPSSSGNIPHLGAKAPPPRPASTSRIKQATARSKPEVVASSDDQDLSEVRMRVATPPSSTLGLSLRWKIVIAMAATTIITAVWIFVTVNSKAVAQLSDEIDAKGIRLVKTLSSIDAAFWKVAIGSASKEDRKKKLDFLVQRINPELTAAARENLFKQNPELRTMYEQLVGDPLGALHTLKTDKKDVGPGSDILQIAVVDVSGGDGSGSVQAVEGLGQQGISMGPKKTDS